VIIRLRRPSPTPPLPENKDGDAEELGYCCEEPSLQWHGDPDAPGIACAHCGYLVAEVGQLLIWRDTTEEEPEKPQGPQQQTSGPRTTHNETTGAAFQAALHGWKQSDGVVIPSRLRWPPFL